MDSRELQEVFAPRQLGDSHTLDFPAEDEMTGVFFGPDNSAEQSEPPSPESFTD